VASCTEKTAKFSNEEKKWQNLATRKKNGKIYQLRNTYEKQCVYFWWNI